MYNLELITIVSASAVLLSYWPWFRFLSCGFPLVFTRQHAFKGAPSWCRGCYSFCWT